MGRRRRKPRLFSFARDVVLASYDNVPLAPTERSLLEAAVDAFVAICDVHRVAPETLLPIARAARHEALVLRGFGITKLTVLSHYFEEAHDMLEQLCRDDDVGLRLFATAALANCPRALALPLLERCLVDPEWSVRKSAAQVATTVDWPELHHIVSTTLPQETDARVRVVMQMAANHAARLANEAP